MEKIAWSAEAEVVQEDGSTIRLTLTVQTATRNAEAAKTAYRNHVREMGYDVESDIEVDLIHE